MSINQIIFLVFVLFGCILGWKPVSNILGPLRLRFDTNMGILDIFFMVFHTMLKILLSMTLGYIFFIIYIIKILIARSKAKKAAASNVQNSSEADTTNT